MKLWQELLLSYAIGFLAFVLMGVFSAYGVMVGWAIMAIIGFIASISVFVISIWLWTHGAKYEKLVELVKKGEEAEALDKLYTAASLESNNTIIDSGELEEICKKAKVKLDFE